MSSRQIKRGDSIFCNGLNVGIVTSVHWTSGAHGMTSTTVELCDKGNAASPGSSAFNSTKIVFGVPGWKKQYRGNLVGNIRIRYRTDGYATIYVRDPYRIREYLLEVDGDYITQGQEIAQNQRTTPRTK